MFDQTFVDTTQKTGKPLSLFVSTLIQICVLGILLLIPLLYTATLPGVMFKRLLVAPSPPVIALPERAPKAPPGRMVRILSGRALYAPVAIPKQVNPSSELGAPLPMWRWPEPTGLVVSLVLSWADCRMPRPSPLL